MRRSWLAGLTEVTKRYLLATAAHNLGRVMWKLLGVGKPRRLQGQAAAAWAVFGAVWSALYRLLRSQTDRAEQPDEFVRRGPAAACLAG